MLIGKRVSAQKKFGEGVVVSAEGSEANTRVEVYFNDYGSKWLILAIANLEIIYKCKIMKRREFFKYFSGLTILGVLPVIAKAKKINLNINGKW